MPFGPYKNFDDCIQSVSHKKHPPTDPQAYCAWIRSKIEGIAGDKLLESIFAHPVACYNYWRLETTLAPMLSVNLLTEDQAVSVLKGLDGWKGVPDAVVLDDHRWIHVWEKALKSGHNFFLAPDDINKLHRLVVAEMKRRGMESGKDHDTPIKIGALKLGSSMMEALLQERKPFLIDSEFISIVGSSLEGKESDVDLLFKTSDRNYAINLLREVPEAIRKSINLVMEPSGPNGIYLPAYALWAIPTKGSMPREPVYHIYPLSPLPAPIPKMTINDPRSLLEDSYFVLDPQGTRCMIHRRENTLMAFDEKMAEVSLPENIKAALLGIKDPRTFILDGFIRDGCYAILDMPWWRESEHIKQNAEQRRYFLSKLKLSPGLELAKAYYFSDRVDAIAYLQSERGPLVLIPGLSTYPVDGKANWYLYQRDVRLAAGKSPDAEIKRLIESGLWDTKSAAERFELMSHRTALEPLYPFAQLKTSRKGYAENEIFGMKSVNDLAKELFRVPSKQAVEVKIDGFRVQLHKDQDQARVYTESGEDISARLPKTIDDMLKLPAKSFILDAEATPYDEKLQNLGRPGAVTAFAKGSEANVDDSRWGYHVFDVLWLDGQPTFDKPYEERRAILHGIELPVRDGPKNPDDFREHLWENTINWATSPEQMIRFSQQATDFPSSEGAMYKDATSKYRLTGSTPLWSKMKALYMIDALVVGDIKQGETHNYIGAIGPVTGVEDENLPEAPLTTLPKDNLVKWKGKIYNILGKTFNTSIEAPVGGIIRVLVKDVNKLIDSTSIDTGYHWFQPKVTEYREDKDAPDNIDAAKLIYKTANIRQSHGGALLLAVTAISIEDAKRVGEQLGVKWDAFTPETFRQGMIVELEHGKAHPQTNVTNDDLLETGKIALVHLRESPKYYDKLADMEKHLSLGNFSRFKCMGLPAEHGKPAKNCDKPPTVDILYAEGMGRIWLCDECFEEWKKRQGGPWEMSDPSFDPSYTHEKDICKVYKIPNGEANKKWGRYSARLLNSRYGEAAELACCQAPWIAIPGEKWIYLANDAEAPGKLTALGVTELVGTKMTLDLVDKWDESGIFFRLAEPEAIDLAEPSEPNEVSIAPTELAEFISAITDPRGEYECMKLSCGGLVPLFPLKLESPYLVYPDEKKTWRYVIQFHVRGLSVHGDLRMQIDEKQLVGWTLDMGKSLLKLMVKQLPVSEHRKYGLGANDFTLPPAEFSAKLDTSEGRKLKAELTKKTQEMSDAQLKDLCEQLWKAEVNPILNDPLRKIYTEPKGSMSGEWLTMKGTVKPGLVGATSELEGAFIIMDEGVVEFGAQKSYFHEYWLHGDKINNRVVIRRLPTRKEWNTKESFAWLTFFTKKGEKPYAITTRAVKQQWYPPKDVSALPRYVREQIPSTYQYWNPTVEDQHALRDELATKRISLKLAANLKFTVKRVWHKGQEVQRGLPITRYWLLLHDGKKVIDAWDFGTDADPLQQDGLTARRRDGKDLSDLLAVTGDIPATHPASQTKSLVNHFDTSDSGTAYITEDVSGRLQLRLEGQTLRGTYAFIREDPSSEAWIFQKTERSLIRMAHAGSKTPLQCSLENPETKMERKGDLLILTGPAIKPGEVLPMDGTPTYFTKEGIKKFWPSMLRQPVDVYHGDLKGDVVGFVNKVWFDDHTGWGWAQTVIWHPVAIKMILEHKLPAFSIEVIPEVIWDAEHSHEHVIGGRCIGLAVVPKGACPTCVPVEMRVGSISEEGKVYKYGMGPKEYLLSQYYGLGKSTQEIAVNLSVPRSTLEGWMNKFNIPRRDLKESRHLRATKYLSSGRPSIIALGAGKNPPCTLFSIGNECLLVNAPKNIVELLALKQLKPTWVLIESARPECVSGLSQLRTQKCTVFADASTWSTIRANYKELSGETGAFEDLYPGDRRVLPVGKTGTMGSFEVKTIAVKHGLAYVIGMMDRRIFHCSKMEGDVDAKELKGVSIYIGDGEDGRVEKQLEMVKGADIPRAYFMSPGTGIEEALKDAPYAKPLNDGAEIALGGGNPMAVYSKSVAEGILGGSVQSITRDRPYSEYANQAILFGYNGKVLGLYVEGYPEMQKDKWVYHPRVLRRFEPPRQARLGESVGPYVHDAELI